MSLVVKAHQIVVKVDGETVSVNNGGDVPKGIAKDELDALTASGAIGEPGEPAASPASDQPPTGELKDMKVDELRAVADERGIAHDGLKKEELLRLLSEPGEPAAS